MTVIDRIPGLRGTGNRRAVDKVAELRAENAKLLDRQLAADDYFAILRNDIVTTNDAWQQERQRRQLAEEALASYQVDLDDLTVERDEWRAEVLRLRARFSAQLAAEANAHRITVPPMQRIGADQDTGPIDVRPLWAARDAGLLGPVTNPGHVPTA